MCSLQFEYLWTHLHGVLFSFFLFFVAWEKGEGSFLGSRLHYHVSTLGLDLSCASIVDQHLL